MHPPAPTHGDPPPSTRTAQAPLGFGLNEKTAIKAGAITFYFRLKVTIPGAAGTRFTGEAKIQVGGWVAGLLL